MKYTKIIVLLLCIALSLSVISCKSNGDDVPTAEITTENTLPDVTTDPDTDATTEEEKETVEPSVTDSMESKECFEYATEKFYTFVGNLKNGFLPEIFSEGNASSGGNIKLSADKASLFGTPVLNSAFALSGEYVRNENGLVSIGEFDGENKLGYQLYVTDSGEMYLCLPQIEENKYIGLDTSAVLGNIGTQKKEDGDSSDSVSTGSIFEILEEVFGDATNKLITEEKLEITVYGKKYNARKLNFNYVMTKASADAYGVESVSVDFYVVGDNVRRAEFKLSGKNTTTVLSIDFNYADGKTEFNGSFATDESKMFDVEGEISDSLDSGKIKLNFVSAGADLGNAGISVSYERRTASGTVFTDYVLGLVVSAGVSEMTVGIPIHTECKTSESGDVTFKLSIDTAKDNIPKMLAEIKASFEMTRLASNTDNTVVFPEFTDDNTIRADDKNDREELKAYYEKLNEQFPDIKSVIADLIKMLGVQLPGSNEQIYLNGTYAQSGLVSITKFTFDESGKVILTIITHKTEGSYSIVGNEISFDFGEGHALTGTFPFENKESSIVIDGTEYVKE